MLCLLCVQPACVLCVCVCAPACVVERSCYVVFMEKRHGNTPKNIETEMSLTGRQTDIIKERFVMVQKEYKQLPRDSESLQIKSPSSGGTGLIFSLTGC